MQIMGNCFKSRSKTAHEDLSAAWLCHAVHVWTGQPVMQHMSKTLDVNRAVNIKITQLQMRDSDMHFALVLGKSVE